MDLRIRDLARLLGESEETVYRWAREGSLPAQRVYEQYWVNRVDLQEWAAANHRPLPPELFAQQTDSELPSVRDALLRGGIFRKVQGSRREDVLTHVANLPGLPSAVDRDLLRQLLISRERVASSAIGDGIAIPHTRDPLVVRVDAPVLLLCFLSESVDFRAYDGKPVRLLFTLLSPSVQSHLQVLSRLALVMHDAGLRALLDDCADDDVILARIETLEHVNAP